MNCLVCPATMIQYSTEYELSRSTPAGAEIAQTAVQPQRDVLVPPAPIRP